MEFKASNGVRVRIDNPYLDLNTGWDWKAVGRSEETQALREFFQAERDEELGRWRWPENPDYVVYARGDGWLVLSERSGNSKHYSHRDHASVGNSELTQAMRSYFEAHPEPKPWHDAKPGEVWVLTVNGVDEPLRTIYDGRCVRFYPLDDNGSAMTYGTRSDGISAARRIWPESD